MSITRIRAAMLSYGGETPLRNDSVDPWPEGTSGTGMDRLIDLLVSDEGLQTRIPTSEIAEAARAADGMNNLIIDAIRATGVGNNRTISISDLRDVSDYIRSDAGRYAEFIRLHGDDENDEETGFHLAQNDGATGRLFDQNAVNTVMDGIYHLGFEIKNGRTTNEDGNANASLASLADWLTDLLHNDLAAGNLANPDVDGYATGTTGTGLDDLVSVIARDEGLNRKIATSDITMGAEAANQMNHILVDAIKATGVANDGVLTIEDLRDVSAWIYRNRSDDWTALHGDDEDGVETGFHLVQGDGGTSKLFGQAAVNTVADGIYHIGFMIENDRFLNEDGNANARVETVLDWVNEFLRDDLANGTLANGPAPVRATPVTADAQPDTPILTETGRDDTLTAAAEIAVPDALYRLDAPLVLDGTKGGHVELADPDGAFALSQGTFAMTFTADKVGGRQALFAKDLRGREGEGEFTVWLEKGAIKVTHDLGGKTFGYKMKPIKIEAGTEHSLAYSFGPDGFQLFIDGDRVVQKSGRDKGIEAVDAVLTLGASRAYANADQDARNPFDGTISDFAVFDTQLSVAQVQSLSAAGGVPIDDVAANAISLPVFEQIGIKAIKASDKMTALATEFGVSKDGVLTVDGDQITGGIGHDVITGTAQGDILTGGLGADELKGGAGADALLGGAGNDLLLGGDGNDIIDGGAGSDRVAGGAGDDLIVSRADAGEPVPVADAGARVTPLTPVSADDVLSGGDGADTFLFQTLLNAKQKFLENNAGKDGVLRWNKIAQKNDDTHDSWIEGIGNDVIVDFSAAEGDVIHIEGYTTKIKSISYGDENDDGVFDHTVIALHSHQGKNGGAHHLDDLGTITVYGDLVTRSDIVLNAKPYYGTITTLTDLELAHAPEAIAVPAFDIDMPDQSLTAGPALLDAASLDPVFSIAGTQSFDRDDRRVLDFGTEPPLTLASGTVTTQITLSEDMATANTTQVIFSKDNADHDGGHMVMYVRGGRLFVEIEKDSGAKTLNSGEYILDGGQTYDVAFAFGADGAHLYLNGEKVDNDPYLTVDWTDNTADLTVGASGAWRSDSNPTWTWDHFDGDITDFAIHDRALTRDEVAAISTGAPLSQQAIGAAAIVGAGQPDIAAGTGLTGEVFDMAAGFASVADLEAKIAENDRTHAFSAVNIDFGAHADDDDVDGFLGTAGSLTEGDGDAAMETIGLQLSGFVYIPAGRHDITVRSDDGFVLRLGGEVFSSHQNARSFQATSRSADFGEGGLYEFELSYYENYGAEGLRLELDGETIGAEQFFASVADYQDALAAHGVVDPDADAPAIIDAPDMPAVYEGTGLNVEIFNADSGWSSVNQLVEQVEGGALDVTHTGTASIVDFGGANQASTIGNFIGENGTLATGDGSETMTYTAVRLTGFVYIPEGEHRITVRSDDGYLLRIAGEDFSSHQSPRATAATHQTADFGGGLYPVELFYYENGGVESLQMELNGTVIDAAHFYASVEDFQAALDENGPMPQGGLPPRPEDQIATTGTGLDALVDKVLVDPGLEARLPEHEITEGARAANGINEIILDAIKATGVANDGALDASDLYDVSAWIRENRNDAFIALHGDDEDGVETGFHLVQNDGANGRMYARNAINTVADGIYHMGFEIENGRFLNEDGNQNARVEDVAHWVSDLLKAELADGSLANPDATPEVTGTTGTGLDAIVTLINEDSELQRRISNEDIRDGAMAANNINALILEGIMATGAANDGKITMGDLYAVNAWIRSDADRLAEFMVNHGDDENGVETGYHNVQNDGAITRLFGDNAMNTVADGIYHIGFEIKNGRFLNEDGNANARVEDVAYWLDSLLAVDMRGTAGPAEPSIISPLNTLANADVEFYAAATTGTGLDQLVAIINRDEGLEQRISYQDQKDGAEAANALNEMIVDGIKATGVANDGKISAGDIYLLSDYIQSDAERYARFIELHGDDENNEETGFHLVQNDGAHTRLYAENAVNTIADGIYHIGFGIKNERLINEDGNANARIEDVAEWLNTLLADDLDTGDLANDSVDPLVTGDTGTGLDRLVDIVNTDSELNRRISTADIMGGAEAANGINAMIVTAIQELGLGNDGELTASDVYDINSWIRENKLEEFTALHGDDENNEETGFHLVQNDGAITRLYGENAVNTVADGIFHIGFEIQNGRFLNEDGNANASVEQVADWLNLLLDGDLDIAADTPDAAVDAVRNTLSDAIGGDAADYIPDPAAASKSLATPGSADDIVTKPAADDSAIYDSAIYDSIEVYGDDALDGLDIDADDMDAAQLRDIMDDTTS